MNILLTATKQALHGCILTIILYTFLHCCHGDCCGNCCHGDSSRFEGHPNGPCCGGQHQRPHPPAASVAVGECRDDGGGEEEGGEEGVTEGEGEEEGGSGGSVSGDQFFN